MICSIDCRTHQVCSASIHTDILFVCVFLMDCFCHEAAIWSHHKSSHLCIDCYITHISRNEHFFVYLLYPCTDHTDIIRNLIRFICDSYTTGQIDKTDLDTQFLFDFNTQFK